MAKLLLLDLFCKAGGASMGYHRAGFDVTGCDNKPQKNYPFTFIKADAIECLRSIGERFDVIAASPPCQRFSGMTVCRRSQHTHPDLIGPIRDLLQASGKPYVIENVPGAPLHNPLVLCGTMFGLKVIRHRLFESNISLTAPAPCCHPPRGTIPRAGRGASPDGWICVCGNTCGVKAARAAMGIDWTNRDELAQAIPPAYTSHVGGIIMRRLQTTS